MKTRFNLRFTQDEMSQLKNAVSKNGMTITDYIKYRLFINNPELQNTKFTYEIPESNKHNYLLMGMLQDVYQLVLHVVSLNNEGVDTENIKAICREQARKNIANYGYFRVSSDE